MSQDVNTEFCRYPPVFSIHHIQSGAMARSVVLSREWNGVSWIPFRTAQWFLVKELFRCSLEMSIHIQKIREATFKLYTYLSSALQFVQCQLSPVFQPGS